jgi:hypothetical protein
MDERRHAGFMRRIHAPSPAIVISIIALVFATAGGAVAATGTKGPVSLVTATGGPVTVTAESAARVTDEEPFGHTIPLSGKTTFMQKAGQALLFATELSATNAHYSASCDLYVLVSVSTGGSGFGSNFGLDTRVLAERGGSKDSLDSVVLAAPAADRVITLSWARAWAYRQLEDGTTHDCDDDSGNFSSDTWTLSLRVSVIRMPA